MFNRYIYIGDIHGNEKIISFLDQYNDGNTMFIITGDIFDRGKYSFEVFIKIKELFEQGVLQGVLGNHDLFFIFSNLDNHHKHTYKTQFKLNNGASTIKSFRKNIQYKDNWEHNNIGKGLVEISKWLLENFNLYNIDDLNNITIHGGIPILYDGILVGNYFDEEYLEGIEYIKKLNFLIKNKNNNTIKEFTTLEDTTNIIDNINKFNGTYHYIPSNFKNSYDLFLPTWYRSKEYIGNDILINSIITELNKNNLNKLILGHDASDLQNYNIENRIYRIDLGIGILILDNDNIEKEFIIL